MRELLKLSQRSPQQLKPQLLNLQQRSRVLPKLPQQSLLLRSLLRPPPPKSKRRPILRGRHAFGFGITLPLVDTTPGFLFFSFSGL